MAGPVESRPKLAVSLYPLHNMSPDHICRMVALASGGYGVSVFRAVLLCQSVYSKPCPGLDAMKASRIVPDLEQQLYDWFAIQLKPTLVLLDCLLVSAMEHGCEVIVELSDVAGYLVSLGVAPLHRAFRPVWNAVIRTIASRINSLTAHAYTNDPTILCYTVLGEVVPYASAPCCPTGPTNVHQVDDICCAFDDLSATLKRFDCQHKIGSGGFLHFRYVCSFCFEWI